MEKEKFLNWLVSARVGQDVVYFTGDCCAKSDAARAAYRACQRGEVFLYQKRLSWGSFAYHALRISEEAGLYLRAA